MNEHIAEVISATPPEGRLGFTVDRRRLRLQFDQGVPFWAAILGVIGLIGLGAGFVAWRAHRREAGRLREESAARQRALHAREAERSRLAREIHDGPLQDIHALRMMSEAEPVDAEAARIARELRAIAEGLRPPALGRFGLAAALSAHASRVKERHPGLSIDLDLDEDRPDALPDTVRSALFRVAQESITNAVEHGQAATVRIEFRLDTPDDDAITLAIADDGRGLPWEAAPDLGALADGGHFGLVGMHERAAAIGGSLSLDGPGLDGRGARVQIRLPVASLTRHAPTPTPA